VLASAPLSPNRRTAHFASECVCRFGNGQPASRAPVHVGISAATLSIPGVLLVPMATPSIGDLSGPRWNAGRHGVGWF
jgi:hypothetical protein